MPVAETGGPNAVEESTGLRMTTFVAMAADKW